jgi:hypothetical protein
LPLPKPELGLVVSYGFVWAGADRRPPPDAGKNRPCLIIDLEEVVESDIGGRKVMRVTYLPISHTPPRDGEQAVKVPPRVAHHLRLTEPASYIYTSYAVEDDWPFDLVPIPGSAGRFDYGLIPPKLFAAIAREFSEYLDRHPRTVHRRGG